ncbi:UDP-forming cellulose synthase catalytic subunit [Kaistia dalseonensis]|uniref:Cellulose synthase catalytic subunit [UDP-forming] n=1 Tax=Kaistia dalseonensis TaxID=410840 RepID=A0ABU0HB47_9HYPH|nr:UDP-forming cellulose synthase catalytic subunit [Kaistia dalseonensis]MCX5496909.1 UDP-forming cellulose synthase catalytic subunit [Kaistia dalseonensis]MDQ0439534.1 cellulose synthase (UDP-forming) [Kaistia dalseonensis]
MTRIAIAVLWGISALAVIILITLPINLQAHLVAGATVVGVMILLKLFTREGVWRQIALALGTSIVLRYAYWRTTSTLPPINEPENFIPGVLVYIAEMYSIFMLFLSLFVVMRPMAPRSLKVESNAPDLPSVDVFVPTYNEEAELLATTLAAAKAMDYPADKLTVWLLDDGGTIQKRHSDNLQTAHEAEERYVALQKLAADLDCRYLTRERNEHAKAGNMNNGLGVSKGDLIAVFDADHAPARDFLNYTVGYFAQDPKLFLVQTPHFFLNPDPVERNLRTFETMPSENEMFYGIIQRGLDKWDASFFCGSAAVLRREALDQTGGFSGVSITEDAETALELHATGWHSVYVDRPLIAGLQPATFTSFIGQRSRWAQGMMQILRFRFPPLKRGLSIPQRLCYMSSTLFWFFPLTRWVFLLAPLCYLFFNLEIFTASGAEFLAYTSSYMLVNLMMQNYLYGRFRWPWISELYEYVQSVYLLPALISVILNPSKPTFKVTAKNESLDEARISELARPFYIIFFLLVAGLIMTVWRIYSEPYKTDVALVVGGWNLLNLLIAGCALGVVSERQESRQSRRVSVKRRCDLLIGDRVFPATIEDASVGGARINATGLTAQDVHRGMICAIRYKTNVPILRNELPISVRTVAGGTGGLMLGCRYDPTIADHYRLISDLVFSSSDLWYKFLWSRRVNIGILRGTIWFVGLALYQTGRGLGYLTKIIRRSPSKTAAPVAGKSGA